MGRNLRIQYPNAWYHVMNRGAAKQNIFLEPWHYHYFLKLLADIHKRYQVEIHSYCLMPNHYHLLMRTPYPNLSRALAYLNSVYTRKFNYFEDKDGALFRGRFHSILIEEENYLFNVSQYIHLNPVKAKLVKTPELFEWSSFQAYVGLAEKPIWLYCDDVLSQLGVGNLTELYHKLTLTVNLDELNKFYSQTLTSPLVTIKSLETHNDLQVRKRNLPSLETIFEHTANYYKISMMELKAIPRKKKNLPRSMAIYIATQYAQKTLLDVASYLEYKCKSTISKSNNLFDSELNRNNKLQQELNTLVSTIELK